MKSLKTRPFQIVSFMLLLCFGIHAPKVHSQETICIDGKCYPVVSRTVVSETPSSMVASVDALSVEATSLKSDSRQFKKSLLEASRQARRSGEISAGQHLAIIALAQRPAKLEQMKLSVHELAIEDGLATTTAIDWMRLIEFIIKVLPELISIFR